MIGLGLLAGLRLSHEQLFVFFCVLVFSIKNMFQATFFVDAKKTALVAADTFVADY